MYLAISNPGLISTHSNVLPKQVPGQHHFAGPPSLHRVLPTVCTAQDDCDWFKEIQTGQSVFFFYSRTTMGAASPFLFQLWNSNVEIDLAMQD